MTEPRAARRRLRRRPRRLSPVYPIFGWSCSWGAICLWNGQSFWVQVPLVCFEVGVKAIELGLGWDRHHVALTLRWSWS